MSLARKIFLIIRNQIPPWRQRAQRSRVKDVEVERSLARARQSSELAIQAIRDAYRLADERIHGST